MGEGWGEGENVEFYHPPLSPLPSEGGENRSFVIHSFKRGNWPRGGCDIFQPMTEAEKIAEIKRIEREAITHIRQLHQMQRDIIAHALKVIEEQAVADLKKKLATP